MGKKKKKEVIKMEDVKSIAFDFELSVPKKEFDELKQKRNLLTKKLIKKRKKKNRNYEVIPIFAAYH